MSSCVKVWQNSQRLANRCEYFDTEEKNRKQCAHYKGISLLSLPGKAYAKCLEKKCRDIVESKLEDGHYGFGSDRSITDQKLHSEAHLREILEVCKDLFACFVDLVRAYDRVLWDSFGRFYGSMTLMVSCYVPLSHATVDWRFVFG